MKKRSLFRHFELQIDRNPGDDFAIRFQDNLSKIFVEGSVAFDRIGSGWNFEGDREYPLTRRPTWFPDRY